MAQPELHYMNFSQRECEETREFLENYLNVNHPRADLSPARVSVEVFGPTLFIKNLDETVLRHGKQIQLLSNLTKEECKRKIYSTPHEYLELSRQRFKFTNDEITELKHQLGTKVTRETGVEVEQLEEELTIRNSDGKVISAKPAKYKDFNTKRELVEDVKKNWSYYLGFSKNHE